MIQGLVQGFVVSFVVRQLEKFGSSIDWEKVRLDADVRIRAIVPGTWFDDYAVGLVDNAIGLLQGALSNEEAISDVLRLIAAGQYNDVLSVIAGALEK